MSILVAALTLPGCGASSRNSADGSTAVSESQGTSGSEIGMNDSSSETIVVPAGTRMNVRLDTGLNSGRNRTGDTFSASVEEAVRVGGRTAIPAGSTVHGTVSSVVPAKQGAGNALMVLAFNRLETPDNSSTTLVASLSRHSESKKKRNATIIGGSAAGGAVLGRIVGKNTRGAVVGSLLGGAIGTGVVMSKEGAQIDFPEGTVLTIKIDEEVRVPTMS